MESKIFFPNVTKATVIDTTKEIAAYGKENCIIFVFFLKVIRKEKQI